VAFGRKLQDGWRPWVAPAGNAGPSASKTSECPSYTGRSLLDGRRRESGDEAQGGRAPGTVLIVGGVKTVARRSGLQAPCSIERSGRAPGTEEPQERSRVAQVSRVVRRKAGCARRPVSESLAWFRAEQTVERVRNPEDGKWWRIVHPAISQRCPILSNAEGAQNPRRGGSAFARADPVVRQSSFEETDNSQRGNHRGQIR